MSYFHLQGMSKVIKEKKKHLNAPKRVKKNQEKKGDGGQ